MSVTLRVTLILGSLFFVALVFSTINRKKLQMGDSLLWLLMSLILILIAVFPQICAWASRLIGIETSSNFIYLIALAVLFILAFRLTIQNSRLQAQTRRLIQLISIENYMQEKRRQETDERQ